MKIRLCSTSSSYLREFIFDADFSAEAAIGKAWQITAGKVNNPQQPTFRKPTLLILQNTYVEY